MRVFFVNPMMILPAGGRHLKWWHFFKFKKIENDSTILGWGIENGERVTRRGRFTTAENIDDCRGKQTASPKCRCVSKRYLSNSGGSGPLLSRRQGPGCPPLRHPLSLSLDSLSLKLPQTVREGGRAGFLRYNPQLQWRLIVVAGIWMSLCK